MSTDSNTPHFPLAGDNTSLTCDASPQPATESGSHPLRRPELGQGHSQRRRVGAGVSSTVSLRSFRNGDAGSQADGASTKGSNILRLGPQFHDVETHEGAEQKELLQGEIEALVRRRHQKVEQRVAGFARAAPRVIVVTRRLPFSIEVDEESKRCNIVRDPFRLNVAEYLAQDVGTHLPASSLSRGGQDAAGAPGKQSSPFLKAAASAPVLAGAAARGQVAPTVISMGSLGVAIKDAKIRQEVKRLLEVESEVDTLKLSASRRARCETVDFIGDNTSHSTSHLPAVFSDTHLVQAESQLDAQDPDLSPEGRDSEGCPGNSYEGGIRYEPIMLSDETLDEGYCNSILSPLFHYRTPPIGTGYEVGEEEWSSYCQLNQLFADAVRAVYEEGDVVFILDHQLMLVPKLLREAFPLAHIAFYLSSVFPSSEMYRILPQRQELLKGLLSATLIGFHSFTYKRHFLTSCTRILGLECRAEGIEACPEAGGCGSRVVAVARGLDPAPWLVALKREKIEHKIAEMRQRFSGRKIILGVDALHYVKGIPHKMMAFHRFLQNNPEWATQCVYLQIALPEDVGGIDHTISDPLDCRAILEQVYHVAGAINAEFGSIDAVPVHFLHQHFTYAQLVPVLALGDVCLVTPLRESASLTAYEFTLCQHETQQGVVVLSEFSGSAQALGAAGICVNPWDISGFASAIHDALTMGEDERKKRHEYAFSYAMKNTTRRWAQRLMHELVDAIHEQECERVDVPPLLSHDEVVQAFSSTTRHIIILGFRGTLFTMAPQVRGGFDLPELFGHAGLSDVNQQSLDILTSDPRNTVVIISSDRPEQMESTFNHPFGSRLCLAAENGHVIRWPGQTHWKWMKEKIDLSWKESVKDILAYFVERTPGSVVYETETSISWLYQNTQRDFGAMQARDLLIHLWAGPLVGACTECVVGSQSVEVRSAEITKSTVTEALLSELLKDQQDPSETCLLSIGNFLMRDEDIFGVIARFVSGINHDTLRENRSFHQAMGMQAGLSSSANLSTSASDADIDRSATRCEQKDNTPTLPTTLQRSSMFCCTVGRKVSKAQRHLHDAQDVACLLAKLAAQSLRESAQTPMRPDGDPITAH